jgi:hypothetical protein
LGVFFRHAKPGFGLFPGFWGNIAGKLGTRRRRRLAENGLQGQLLLQLKGFAEICFFPGYAAALFAEEFRLVDKLDELADFFGMKAVFYELAHLFGHIYIPYVGLLSIGLYLKADC